MSEKKVHMVAVTYKYGFNLGNEKSVFCKQTVKLSKALPSLFFMSYASEVRAEPCRLTTIYISNFNNFAHNKPNQQANSDITVVFSRIWYI